MSPEQYASRDRGSPGADVVIESGGETLATHAGRRRRRRPARPGAGRGRGRRISASPRSRAPGVGDAMMVRLLMPDRDSASPTSSGVARRGGRVRRLPGARRSRSRSRSRGACSRRSSGCWRRRSGSAAATSRSRCRRRATTSSPRSARSSTRWRASSRRGWRSSSASASACRSRSGGSASRSPPASIASACWRSSCRPPSRASAPRPAAPRCAGRTNRLHEVARTGEPEAFRRALHAAEAAVIDAGAGRRDPGRRRQRAGRAARRQRGRRPGDRHRLGRPRRPRVHARRARAVRLPDQPGVGLGRERRPARDRAAPGGHRRADRPVQPPPLPGGHVRRGRARPPLRAARWA